MELKVESSRKDKLFDRTIINFEITPAVKEIIKLDDAKKKLAEKFNEGYLVVYTLKNIYGFNKIKGVAHIYKDETAAKRILQKYILQKNGVVYAEKQKEEKGNK
jgi:ribosomal protein S24E